MQPVELAVTLRSIPRSSVQFRTGRFHAFGADVAEQAVAEQYARLLGTMGWPLWVSPDDLSRILRLLAKRDAATRSRIPITLELSPWLGCVVPFSAAELVAECHVWHTRLMEQFYNTTYPGWWQSREINFFVDWEPRLPAHLVQQYAKEICNYANVISDTLHALLPNAKVHLYNYGNTGALYPAAARSDSGSVECYFPSLAKNVDCLAGRRASMTDLDENRPEYRPVFAAVCAGAGYGDDWEFSEANALPAADLAKWMLREPTVPFWWLYLNPLDARFPLLPDRLIALFRRLANMPASPALEPPPAVAPTAIVSTLSYVK